MPTLIVSKAVGRGRIDAKWCTLRAFGVEKLPYSFFHFISQYMSVVLILFLGDVLSVFVFS